MKFRANFFRKLRKHRLPCTPEQANNVLWLKRMEHLPQTQIAHILNLGEATVSRVVRGRRYPYAYPVPPARRRPY